MTKKYTNGNTKVSNDTIVIMYEQRMTYQEQINNLREAKNRVPANFGITDAQYHRRVKELKAQGVIA